MLIHKFELFVSVPVLSTFLLHVILQKGAIVAPEVRLVAHHWARRLK